MQSTHVRTVTEWDMSSRTNSKSIYVTCISVHTKWHAMLSAIRVRQCLRSQAIDIGARSVGPCKCLPRDVLASKLIQRNNEKREKTKTCRGPENPALMRESGRISVSVWP